jgi:uncharacterized protein (DUF58 family)
MASNNALSDVPYRIIWRSRALRQGAHRSTHAGSGGVFRDLASLLEYRDPRRIDLRQTMRDPFGALHVRRFEERSQIGVTMLLDVSGSMGFSGAARKMAIAADLAQVFSASARRAGDTFALFSADETIREELCVAPQRSRAGEPQMVDAIRTYVPLRRGASGLVDAARRVGRKRNLVIVGLSAPREADRSGVRRAEHARCRAHPDLGLARKCGAAVVGAPGAFRSRNWPAPSRRHEALTPGRVAKEDRGAPVLFSLACRTLRP